MTKQIPSFPNYCITPDGWVWSNFTNKFLKPVKKSTGYLCVSLSEGKTKAKQCHIHTLVLKTFVGDCPIGMEACHINGNRQHNHIYNLRWDTRKNNHKDALQHGTHKNNYPHVPGEKNGHHKLTEKDVRMIIYMYRTNLFKKREIADVYGVSQCTINDIVTKRTWVFVWR